MANLVLDLSFDLLAGLFAVACAAGFVDSIAGGGGLLTVPAMLIAGMDPVAALATNKLQGTFSVASASWSYARHGAMDWRTARGAMIVAALAAALGASFVASVPTDDLKAVLPFVLIAIAVYFLLSPKPADVDAEPRIGPRLFAGTVVPAIGFYDGAMGPGTGSFLTLGLLALRGQSILRATGTAKLLNLASNVGSLILFVVAGKLVWSIGLVMAAGSVIGAQVGSRLAIAGGARVIKPVLVLACCAMAAKLLADPAHPVWGWLG